MAASTSTRPTPPSGCASIIATPQPAAALQGGTGAAQRQPGSRRLHPDQGRDPSQPGHESQGGHEPPDRAAEKAAWRPRPATPPSRPAAPAQAGRCQETQGEIKSTAASPCWSDLPGRDKRMQYGFCDVPRPPLIAIDGAGLRHVEFVQGSARPAATGGSGMMLALALRRAVCRLLCRPPAARSPLAATGTPFQQAVAGVATFPTARPSQLPPDCRAIPATPGPCRRWAPPAAIPQHHSALPQGS